MADVYRVEKWAERTAPNGAMLRLRMEAGGYRVFQWSDRPGAFFGMHKKAEAQSHWVISGSLEITVQSRAYLLEAGDRDYMPAGTYHTARVIGEEPVVYLVGEMPSAGVGVSAEPGDPVVGESGRFPPEVLEFFDRVGVPEYELMRPPRDEDEHAGLGGGESGPDASEEEEGATSEREG